MDRNDKRTMEIVIGGVTEAQALAIEDMLAAWVSLGSMGASRWTAFYADGDGNFHPQITVNGQKPEATAYVTKEQRWSRCKLTEEMYFIDFDRIAWALRARDEPPQARFLAVDPSAQP